MVLTKKCSFGDRMLDIDVNTKVRLCLATVEDVNRYENDRWENPVLPEFNDGFWKELCRWVNASSKKDLRESIFSVFSSLKNIDFPKSNLVPLFSLSMVEQTVESGNRWVQQMCIQIAFALGIHGKFVTLQDGCDYALLLDVVSRYVDENNVYRTEMVDFLGLTLFRDSNPSYGVKRLASLLEQHKDYVNSYKKYAVAYRKKTEDPLYQKYKALDIKKGIRVLYINDIPFLETICGFDVGEKYNEAQAIVRKLKNTNNCGENKVDYAIKWCKAEMRDSLVVIEPNCESKYRYDCILLHKPDYIEDAQEYDHILVTTAGILLIETKNWDGKILIRPDGKWLRESSSGYMIGTDSPAFQMRRHEMLIKSILPGVPVHSFLCISGATAVIEGREFFNNYPIVFVDQLEEKIAEITAKQRYSQSDVESMVAIIEAHKVNQK